MKELLIAALGLGFLWTSKAIFSPTIKVKQKVEKGQAFAKLIYTDEKGGKLLFAPTYGLKGKPDYIFQSLLTGAYIPFEIKSGKCKEDEPHPGDLMQLVAYFLIIEELYGKKPPYGKLVYANKTFKVRYTKKLKKELIHTLSAMRQMLEGKCHQKAEPSYIKCKNCICKDTVCDWYEEEKA